jgi:hypothetical protein
MKLQCGRELPLWIQLGVQMALASRPSFERHSIEPGSVDMDKWQSDILVQ